MIPPPNASARPIATRAVDRTNTSSLPPQRDPHRPAHLANIKKALSEKKLVIAGALADPIDGAMFVFKGASKAEVEAFVEADAYKSAGLISGVEIRPYMVVSLE